MIPPLAYRVEEAAKALGISADSFQKYVQANVRSVRVGSLRLYPHDELRRWLEENATSPADELERRRRAA